MKAANAAEKAIEKKQGDELNVAEAKNKNATSPAPSKVTPASEAKAITKDDNP